MKRVYIVVFFVCIVALLSFLHNSNQEKPREESITEGFIKSWLINENGTLATYILEGDFLDADLVKGREALSESLGLWMHYALAKEDKQLFAEAYRLLARFFLEKDGYVHWKLTELGKSEVSTNALIDDLRIIHALFQASEKWNINEYKQEAKRISLYVNQHNHRENVLTDYYDRKIDLTSTYITLSYIEPNGLKEMLEHGVLHLITYETMLAILGNTPREAGFYPKKYDVEQQMYLFDEEVNMIDQALVALHGEQIGLDSQFFLEFITTEMREHGKVFGKYNRITGLPTVQYESPAIYALLILYSIELGELDLASLFYKRMNSFRNHDVQHIHFGGYSVSPHGDTHIFDNLLPLLAEKIFANIRHNS